MKPTPTVAATKKPRLKVSLSSLRNNMHINIYAGCKKSSLQYIVTLDADDSTQLFRFKSADRAVPSSDIS
jgi:hypothetical protein